VHSEMDFVGIDGERQQLQWIGSSRISSSSK
jgi:hypothetical protein